MVTKIRDPEPQCTISLERPSALDLLSFLVSFSDQTATQEIEDIIKEVIGWLKKYILSKGGGPSTCLELDKVRALEFYLHLRDFYDRAEPKTRTALDKCMCQIRDFLIGDTNVS